MRKGRFWSNQTLITPGNVVAALASNAESKHKALGTSGSTTFLNAKRVGDELSLLAFVNGERADGRTGAGIAPGIGDFTFEHVPQARLHEGPRAHVLRFFLTPNNPDCFRKWFENVSQSLFVQRIELFDTDNGGVVDLALVAVFQEIIIDFSRTKNYALDCVGRTNLRRSENFFETPAGEIFRRRRGKLGTQQTFRRHDDERLDEFAFHLTAQEMEILRRGCRVADLDIVFGAGLQETFEAGDPV